MHHKLLLAVTLLAACHRGKPHPPAPHANPHGAGIDREMTSLKAMFQAPIGKTPCETAYNAFKAGDDAGRGPGRTALVLRLAPRDEFLSRCNALPPEAQPCLAPAYSSRHREECLKNRPSSVLLEPMFALKPVNGVQAGERDGDQQFMSTQSANRPPAANMQ
jgi:hypothetical protein